MKKKQRSRGRPPLPAEKRKGERIEFRAEPGEREAYESAAEKAGMERSEWMRDRLNKAADRELRGK